METRTIRKFYDNDAPDVDMNDLYAEEHLVYYAIPDEHVAGDAVTVAQVDGEDPPADHTWVEVLSGSVPTGYTYNAAITETTFDDWADGVTA